MCCRKILQNGLMQKRMRLQVLDCNQYVYCGMNIAYKHSPLTSTHSSGTPMKLLSTFAAAVLFAFATGAQATPMIYSHPGMQNTQLYSFTAASTGDLMAYFVGSTAAYTNEIT